MHLLNPTLLSSTSSVQYPSDAFDKLRGVLRFVTHEGELCDLSQTNAFLAFGALRKHLMSQDHDTYATSLVSNVRLFLLVVRKIGVHFREENVLLYSPASSSTLSALFPWL